MVAWRGLAEICHKLVKKGARIYVEGKLQTRNFEDKTGVRKHVVEILIDNMLLLDGKRSKDAADDKIGLDLEENFTMSSFSDEDFLSMMPDASSTSVDFDEEKSIF